jgi:hypothetical protein
MPTNMPVMPLIFMGLMLLPFRLSSGQLKGLAFFLWLTGGLVLAIRGGLFMAQDPSRPAMGLLLGACALALIIGLAKGRFVLSKTSRRNIERLEALTEPQRPLAVYSLRSWILIALMVGISVALNFSGLPLLWRGTINLAIGAALMMSSLAYLQSAPKTTA